MFEITKPRRVFERRLPGAGLVAIETWATSSLGRGSAFQGRVIVERRATPRAGEHEPPVVATASGATSGDVVGQLLTAAQCNAAIGAALLRSEHRESLRDRAHSP